MTGIQGSAGTDINGIQLAPAPWKLKCRTWTLLISPLNSNKVDGKSLVSFPAGWAAPFECDALSEGEFVGGLGMVMLVQYTETPVGPYDELVYCTGKYTLLDENGKPKIDGQRITRIYVSTKESTANGRRNWNIPKQVADFKYTHNTDGSWDLAVSLASNSESTNTAPKPFFHISVNPIPLLSHLHIPINSAILGNYLRVLQPPLPKGPPGSPPEVVGSDTNGDGTTKEAKWAALVPNMKGKMHLATYKPEVSLPGEEEGGKGGKAIADGVNFPAVVPWKVVTCLEDVDIDFGVANWY